MTITEAQSDAYFSTKYRVFTSEGVMELPAQGSEFYNMAALLQKHGASTAAFITAYNPLSQPTDEAINKHKQGELVNEVKARWQFLEGEGTDYNGNWPAEPSLFVFGISFEDAIELGVRYGQNAILFCTDDGEIYLKACNPEHQPLLLHPLQRMTERLSKRLGASGLTVKEAEPSHTNELRATFIPRRRNPD